MGKSRPRRIAVLIKQVPRADQMELRDGRLVREGVELEVNPYCRRANSKAVELAGRDGEVVVFTMGPPAAEEALREMVACGASRAVHLCDAAFAGSDTLATARVVAAAIHHEGPFDLVLAGLNSTDGDTGQVGPEVAALLGLPFAGGVRELTVLEEEFEARLELDGYFSRVRGRLPVVLSVAERLCRPSKAPPEARAAVEASRIRRVSGFDLGLKKTEVGEAGSPTVVGEVRVEEIHRRRWRAATPAAAAEMLEALAVFGQATPVEARPGVPSNVGRVGPEVWCFCEPGNDTAAAELLGEAASIAATVGGTAAAVVPGSPPYDLGVLGADQVWSIVGATEPEQWARALSGLARERGPRVILVPATRVGRTVAATVAAENQWGLVGDAVAIDAGQRGDITAWKPAFSGNLLAAIRSRSSVQLVTVRPGVLEARSPRFVDREAPIAVVTEHTPARVTTLHREPTDPDWQRLRRSPMVVGVGVGVDPAEYPELRVLQAVLGDAPLGATRRVTDNGWLPCSRQIGVTGASIAPRLYVAIGTSGKFNHLVGVRQAEVILALNNRSDAPIFDAADVGLVGDWHETVPLLVEALRTMLQRKADRDSDLRRVNLPQGIDVQ